MRRKIARSRFALDEACPREVGLAEVRFSDRASFEHGLRKRELHELRVVEVAPLERDAEGERPALREVDAEELAVDERDLLQPAVVGPHHREIAVLEPAVDEVRASPYAVREVAVAEDAAFVLARGGRAVAEFDALEGLFVMMAGGLHGGRNLRDEGRVSIGRGDPSSAGVTTSPISPGSSDAGDSLG